jgi:hypothetical protein
MTFRKYKHVIGAHNLRVKVYHGIKRRKVTADVTYLGIEMHFEEARSRFRGSWAVAGRRFGCRMWHDLFA